MHSHYTLEADVLWHVKFIHNQQLNLGHSTSFSKLNHYLFVHSHFWTHKEPYNQHQIQDANRRNISQ